MCVKDQVPAFGVGEGGGVRGGPQQGDQPECLRETVGSPRSMAEMGQACFRPGPGPAPRTMGLGPISLSSWEPNTAWLKLAAGAGQEERSLRQPSLRSRRHTVVKGSMRNGSPPQMNFLAAQGFSVTSQRRCGDQVRTWKCSKLSWAQSMGSVNFYHLCQCCSVGRPSSGPLRGRGRTHQDVFLTDRY